MNAAFEFPASASALQRLTETQQIAVWRAGPLHREDREAFFDAVAKEIAGKAIGDGLLHRCIAATQKKFAKITGSEPEPPAIDAWTGGAKAAMRSTRLDKLLADIRLDAFRR